MKGLLMKKQTYFHHSYLQQGNQNYDFKKYVRGAIVMLLVCMIGLMTIESFAQPLAEGKDKFLGCATSCEIYRYLDHYWNQVTPGNEGKWGSVEPVQGQFNWTDLDKIYNFAANRNMPFKHHTLIWGQQQPGWLGSLDSAAQRAKIEEWIRRVGERYPKMDMVDVVNEPFHATPVYKNALGGDGATGWDWVITAFQLARQYCPDTVKLLINEYNILHSNSQTTNYINLVNLLKDRNLIDGIGIQCHYFEFRSDMRATSNVYIYDINTIKSNLNRLAEIGLPIYISEFDIDEPIDSDQLAQYQIYFPIFWSHPAVKGITFWGYIQGDCWSSHPYTYLLLSDGTERPALQWLRTYIASPLPPVPISPDAAGGVPRNPILIWHTSTSATSYRVQVATSIMFVSSCVIVDTIVADTLLPAGPLDANRRFYWRVSATNNCGISGYSGTASFMTGDFFSSVAESETIPITFQLFQNYPNPFNSSTIISFSLPYKSNVRLVLINVLGKEVLKIAEGNFEVGVHRVQLDASRLASGLYFYKLEAEKFNKVMKMIVSK
jgi:endo-1,4-beta-xylanase